ncbi:unnamed protein product [Ceratitis capitata]|uniref:(Mediterranean fruit fly) hypothetical protein n=1 Tax=Ceratitis capitata TaxID=7213 RepID=A0A811UZ89_CERCA|nr:unnamed protein product [Ceratitis capitata]
MKLAVLAIVLGLCLAVATAEINYSVEENELVEFAPLGLADEITDEMDFSVFGILWFTIYGSLRTLKGVNCIIRRVMSIQSAAILSSMISKAATAAL